MEDEFALCWNNFQENIASGFLNLFDRGDLVDVTLACDGKLLQAHKIVLAICSPYFQEMFISNPCKHPIIILKDVSHTVMSELLQFMYQGVVNVKHAELSSFMKIAQALQIKGLAMSTTNNNHQHQNNSQKSPATSPHHHLRDNLQNENARNMTTNALDNYPLNIIENKIHSALLNSIHSSSAAAAAASLAGSLKRSVDFNNGSCLDTASNYSKKHKRLSSDANENDGISTESLDEEVFMPQVSMETPRFDLSSVKRESGGGGELVGSPLVAIRNFLPPHFNFDYNGSYNKNADYSHDIHNNNDMDKLSSPGNSSGNGNGNHMDIPAVTPGDKWSHGKLEFMLSQRGKPLLVHDGHSFGIQYIRKDKKYWQCNLSRKFNCKARVTTTDTGEIIVTNNEHCHTEIRQHLKKDYKSKMLANNSSGGSNHHQSDGSTNFNASTPNWNC